MNIKDFRIFGVKAAREILVHRVGTTLASPFTRRVALIASGGLVAQALNFAVSPILSRLFAPEAFGLLALFTSVSGLLSPCSTLRYELPIVIPRRDKYGIALIHLCMIVTILLSCISFLIFVIYGDNIGEIFNIGKLVQYFYLISASILFSGIFLAFSQWSCRKKEFSILAKNPIIRTGTTLIINLCGGLLSFGQEWLILGFVSGQFFATICIILQIMKKDFELMLPKEKYLQRILFVAKRYRHFPIFSAPQAVLNVASQQVPNFILIYYFGPTVVGLYWLTVRSLQLPSALIGQAVRQVYYQRICESLNQGQSILPLMIKMTSGLIAFGAACFLPIILWGPIIFSYVFGEPWRESGEYARWVALWSWAGFINVPAICNIQALGMQKQLFAYEIFLFISRNGFLLLFSLIGKPISSVASYALTSMAMNIFIVLYVVLFSLKDNK